MPNVWNFDLHEIRKLLDEGKQHDKQAAKKEKHMEKEAARDERRTLHRC